MQKFTKEKLPDSFDELREEEENEKGRIQCVQNDGDEQVRKRKIRRTEEGDYDCRIF